MASILVILAALAVIGAIVPGIIALVIFLCKR